MPGVSRLTDAIVGTTAGEHNGHALAPHPPLPISGQISGGCSPNVYVNGLPVAVTTATTEEHDGCCGTSSGVVVGCSSTVFVNGKGIVRTGDMINPHNGTANVSGCSSNVFAN